MKHAIKYVLKKLPIAQYINKKFRSWQEIAQVKALFMNHELYLAALKQKSLGTVVLETRDGLSITIRQNIWDARIVKEMLIDKPYIRYFKLPANPVVVDIGGYIGDFSIYAVKYLNANQVIVYEPAAENFEILRQNIKNNDFEDRIIAVNKAVSNCVEVMLNVVNQECGEVHVSTYMYPDGERRILPSVTLADILAEHQLDSVDLLKIDCEGGEYDILSIVKDETFSRIRNIVFEYHSIHGFEKKLKLALNRLKSAGYTLRVEGQYAYAYQV